MRDMDITGVDAELAVRVPNCLAGALLLDTASESVTGTVWLTLPSLVLPIRRVASG
jgi:hypothetical protein